MILRHSEKNAELLLLLVFITESLVILLLISLSSINITAIDLIEGFIERLINSGKIMERCNFTCKSYLCTLAAWLSQIDLFLNFYLLHILYGHDTGLLKNGLDVRFLSNAVMS